METRTVNVYEFSELSPKAQARAIYDDQANGYWPREEEYMDSIKALAKHFDGTLKNWEIDWSNSTGPSSAEFGMPELGEMDDKQIEERLLALGSFNKETLRGDGECKLTGCGTDESAIDGFRAAFMGPQKERDLNVLMQEAFTTWIKAAWAEYEYDYGEGYAETADANDWRYTEDGRFYRENPPR